MGLRHKGQSKIFQLVAGDFSEKLEAFYKRIAVMPQCELVVAEAKGKRTR